MAAGATVEAADLRTVRVADDAGLAVIPAGRADTVVGRRAAVGLVAGSLLAPGELAAGPAGPTGEATVGLSLKAGQVPAGLVPGDVVVLVSTGAPAASGAAGSGGAVLVARARVVRAVYPSSASATADAVVTVAVPEASAPALVAAAAAGGVGVAGLGSGS